MKLLVLFLFLSYTTFSQDFTFTNIDTKTGASFRGLSVLPNEKNGVAWLGGTKGNIGYTLDGGATWNFTQIKGYEKCDFRSIYALSEKAVIIANAGTPAYILFTNDGGKNWQKVFESHDSAVFFDGITFWPNKKLSLVSCDPVDNKKYLFSLKMRGLVYGDPINGKMYLIRLTVVGNYRNWFQNVICTNAPNSPLLTKGEASFAASGTTIRRNHKKIKIATGGTVSRIWTASHKLNNWLPQPTPILPGNETTGIFSMAWANKKKGIIVGGDYKLDTLRKDHVFYTTDGGKTWAPPTLPTRGYRECVEYINKNTAITTGPTGTDFTIDGGKTWQPLNDEKGFHVIKKIPGTHNLIMAGSNGKVMIVREQ